MELIDVKGRFHLVVERVLDGLSKIIGSLGAGFRRVELNHGVVEGVVKIWITIVLEERNTDSGYKIKQTRKGAGSDGKLLGKSCCLAVGEDISKTDSSLGKFVERCGRV